MPKPKVDCEKFRLRRFAEKLREAGELEVHEEPVSLLDLSALIEATPKATLFKQVGPERYEMIAAVAGSRRRIGIALGVDERDVLAEYTRRIANPQPVVEVPAADAPVRQVVRTGDDVDLTTLPFHLQHTYDGCVYLSAAIDYTVDAKTGKRNVGCRRLSLKDRRSMRTNLNWISDLRTIYMGCAERGERLPLNFVVGSHPLDFMAATLRQPGDEFSLVATLRGEPVPMVRGLTNDVLVPADAEVVIEGYLDELGYREQEGPYGEFWGLYGPVHMDPVYHVTAITMRKDALFQTVLHGTDRLLHTEAANLHSIVAELRYLEALRAADIEPAKVHCVIPAQGHARVALRRGVPGQARNAISALFALPHVKHVVVVDDDVDVFSDHEIEWAMSTRFRADRDIVVTHGFPGSYMDPTLEQDGKVAKIGFDATAPYDTSGSILSWRTAPPRIARARRAASVRDALQAGPLFFVQIVQALGSSDGREVAIELGAMDQEGLLERLPNGEWKLRK